MEEIITIIYKLIWGILGGALCIAFLVGTISTIAYMTYFLIKNGWTAFINEFCPKYRP